MQVNQSERQLMLTLPAPSLQKALKAAPASANAWNKSKDSASQQDQS